MRFDVDDLGAQLVVTTLEDEPLHEEVLLLLVVRCVDLPQGLAFRTVFLNGQGSGLVCSVCSIWICVQCVVSSACL